MKTEYDYLAAPLAALRAGNTALAIRQLEELREVKPELVEATYHLGRAWQTAGDQAKAVALFSEILADGKHPFFAHARVRLAELGVDPDARNGGVVPEAVAEATGSEVPGTEAPAQVEAAPAELEAAPAQVEAAPAEGAPAQVEAAPAEAPAPAEGAHAEPAKGKGKKGKAAGGESASS